MGKAKKAVLSCEKFMKSGFQIDIENTVIEIIEKTSLGVEGWALYDFGDKIADIHIAPSLQP